MSAPIDVSAPPTATVTRRSPRNRRNIELLLILLGYALSLLGFAQVDLVIGGSLSPGFTQFAIVLGAGLVAAHVALRVLAPYADPVILPTVGLLNGLGLVMIHRLDLAESSSGAAAEPDFWA
ncbi:MAG: FtsW/RodA/SpoVE family cell cycle protein, partial [Actinomycetes bacterium]